MRRRRRTIVPISASKSMGRGVYALDGRLYDARPPKLEDATLRLVPYHLWDNRAPGEMLVWIRARP